MKLNWGIYICGRCGGAELVPYSLEPLAKANVTDTFDYVVSDGNGGFDSGTVTVNVTGTDVAQYRLVCA